MDVDKSPPPSADNDKSTDVVIVSKKSSGSSSRGSVVGKKNSLISSARKKRKRIRKRKNKKSQQLKRLKFEMAVNEICEEMKPLAVRTKPKFHIKFGADDQILFYEENVELIMAETRANQLNKLNSIANTFDQLEMFKFVPGTNTIRTDDCIVFKVLKLSDNFCPEISQNISGRVITFDANDQQLEIEILRGRDQLYKPFDTSSSEPADNSQQQEEERPQNDYEPYTVNLTSLYEIRIISQFFAIRSLSLSPPPIPPPPPSSPLSFAFNEEMTTS